MKSRIQKQRMCSAQVRCDVALGSLDLLNPQAKLLEMAITPEETELALVVCNGALNYPCTAHS
jgi:hypothetical protein